MYVLCMFVYDLVLCLKVKFTIIIFLLCCCCSLIDSQLIYEDLGNYVEGVDECVYVVCVVNVDVCW